MAELIEGHGGVHRKLSEGGFELPYRTLASCVNRVRLEQARTGPVRLRRRRPMEQKRLIMRGMMMVMMIDTSVMLLLTQRRGHRDSPNRC